MHNKTHYMYHIHVRGFKSPNFVVFSKIVFSFSIELTLETCFEFVSFDFCVRPEKMDN